MRNFVRKYQLAARRSSTSFWGFFGIKRDREQAYKTPLDVPVTPLGSTEISNSKDVNVLNRTLRPYIGKLSMSRI